MPLPGEHKTVQARILEYAQEIGWIFVPRAEAEGRRAFDPAASNPSAAAHGASLYFEDLLHAKVREFNPAYTEAPGALPGILRHLHADIYGNRELLRYLRNQATFFCPGGQGCVQSPHPRLGRTVGRQRPIHQRSSTEEQMGLMLV